MRAQGYVRTFFGIGLDDPDSVLFSHLPRWDTAAKAKAFFSEGLRGTSWLVRLWTRSPERYLPHAAKDWHPFNRGQYLEAKSLLGGYLLSSQGDRMLMANSVEGRFPFLDHRVIEFANRLDPRMKMRVLREKHLLKVAMEAYLPSAILNRPKQPYRAPDIDAFFTQWPAGILPYVDELLSEETVTRYGYFDPHKKVSSAEEEGRDGFGVKSMRDNQAFVGILSTQIWHYLFIERLLHGLRARPPEQSNHVH